MVSDHRTNFFPNMKKVHLTIKENAQGYTDEQTDGLMDQTIPPLCPDSSIVEREGNNKQSLILQNIPKIESRFTKYMITTKYVAIFPF